MRGRALASLRLATLIAVSGKTCHASVTECHPVFTGCQQPISRYHPFPRTLCDALPQDRLSPQRSPAGRLGYATFDSGLRFTFSVMSGVDSETGSPPQLRIFACERCARRKQRCDKVLPTCGQCSEARSHCIDSERESNVVHINDTEIARKGYVTALQERIASLQRRIRYHESAAAQGDLIVHDESHNVSEQPRAIGQHLATPLSENNLALDSTDMEMTSLALSAMAEPSSRAGEFLKHLSMSRIIAGMTETYGGDPERTARVDSLWDGIAKYIRQPTSQNHRLHIQREEALKSLDAYLLTVDFRYPRLPVDKIRQGIEAIAAHNDTTYRQMYARDPSNVFMAYMIVAIVPLVSDNYPISQGSFVSIHVLAKCMKVLDRVFCQEDGIDIIQCLHLLVIFSIHCSAAGSAWHLIGLAMSKCIALGYHREKAHSRGDEDGSDQAEHRRWVFWGCYLLDRLICSALGRPYSIDDRYITVALPGKHCVVALTPEETYHVHLFRYAQILSKAGSNAANQSFEDGISHLLNWRASAPPSHSSILKQAHMYQTSLYHTLMLRFAINEIVSAYSFNSAADCDSGIYISSPGSPIERILSLESIRIQRLKLFSICSAVAQSLNRRHMAGRHYLSLTTGYSALTMALAALYSQIITSLSTTSSQDFIDADVVYDGILDVAAAKLDIVGRQFPRLHEYRDVVERLRCIGRDLRMGSRVRESFVEIDKVKEYLGRTGPMHLRHIGLAIVYLCRCWLQTIRN